MTDLSEKNCRNSFGGLGMSEKVPLNFNVPAPVKDYFQAVAKTYGEKKKWSVCAAAVISLLEMSEHERDERIGDVLRADVRDGDMESLVTDAISASRRKTNPNPQIAPVSHLDPRSAAQGAQQTRVKSADRKRKAGTAKP